LAFSVAILFFLFFWQKERKALSLLGALGPLEVVNLLEPEVGGVNLYSGKEKLSVIYLFFLKSAAEREGRSRLLGLWQLREVGRVFIFGQIGKGDGLAVALRGAGLPGDLDVLEGSYRKLARLGVASVLGRDADFGVDVEETLEAAGRPDGALDAELVGLDVVVVVGALDGHGRRDLL